MASKRTNLQVESFSAIPKKKTFYSVHKLFSVNAYHNGTSDIVSECQSEFSRLFVINRLFIFHFWINFPHLEKKSPQIL